LGSISDLQTDIQALAGQITTGLVSLGVTADQAQLATKIFIANLSLSAQALLAAFVFGVDSELVKDAVGKYHVDIDTTVEGTYPYRMYSTGSGQAAAEGSFRVNKSQFL
jgi:hypothetical protein